MLDRLTPAKILLIAFGLLLAGWILPVLMVMQIIPSTYFLNFFSYTAQLLGTILGFIGTLSIIRRSRRK
jgi:hypothetical protein